MSALSTIINRLRPINWKDLAGRALAQGQALAVELEREQKRTTVVLALLHDDSIDPRMRIARATTILKLTDVRIRKQN